jgi:hypothetical protein
VSPLDWALFALLIVLIVVVPVVSVWLCVKLSGVLTSAKNSIDDNTDKIVTVLGEVTDTVRLVNLELGRVDGILATAEQISQTTGHMVNVVSETVTSPLVRLSAFAYGLRRAVASEREGDGEGRGRGSRRRRRVWGRRR